MKALHKILTAIQDQIGGDDLCRVVADLQRDGSLRLTAAWDNGWNAQAMFTKEQLELAEDPSCFVDLFVVLVKESEAYKSRQEGAG